MDDDVLSMSSDGDVNLLENIDLLPESPDVHEDDEIDLLPLEAALENLDGGDLQMVEDGADRDCNDDTPPPVSVPVFGDDQMAVNVDGAPPIEVPLGPAEAELDAGGTGAPALQPVHALQATQTAQAAQAPLLAGGGSGVCPRCNSRCTGTGAGEAKKRCQRLCCAAAIVL